jgi:ferric-dicitrate binding protein FerR (iron transport regulator)
MVRRLKYMRYRSVLLLAATVVVSLATLHAQDENAATVLVQLNRVSVVDNGYLRPLAVGDRLRLHETIVTGPDGFARFQLSDGSTFDVYSNSRVVFRETPGLTDLLDLFIGRIKVFIEHSKGPNPKDVKTPTAVISVRGTVFDVEVQDEDGTTFVTLDDGLVDVRNLTAPGPSVLLKPGESILVEPNRPLIPQQINQHAAMRLVLRAAEQAMAQVLLGGHGGIGSVGGVGGAQGDKPKPGGTTGTGTGTVNGPVGTGTGGAPAPPPPPPPGH